MDLIKSLICILTGVQILLVPACIYLLVSGVSPEKATLLMLSIFIIGIIKAWLFTCRKKSCGSEIIDQVQNLN